MVVEHVFGGAHVLDGFDGPARVEGDDPINEEEPHAAPAATRFADGALPSRPGGEPRHGRELAGDVVGERANRETVHHLFHGDGRMQIL